VLPAGQPTPAEQDPEHEGVDRPALEPNVPAGHSFGAAPAAQKDPMAQEPARLAVEPGGQLAPAEQRPVQAADDRPIVEP